MAFDKKAYMIEYNKKRRARSGGAYEREAARLRRERKRREEGRLRWQRAIPDEELPERRRYQLEFSGWELAELPVGGAFDKVLCAIVSGRRGYTGHRLNENVKSTYL
jgi:hypothetical protein